MTGGTEQQGSMGQVHAGPGTLHSGFDWRLGCGCENPGSQSGKGDRASSVVHTVP